MRKSIFAVVLTVSLIGPAFVQAGGAISKSCVRRHASACARRIPRRYVSDEQIVPVFGYTALTAAGFSSGTGLAHPNPFRIPSHLGFGLLVGGVMVAVFTKAADFVREAHGEVDRVRERAEFEARERAAGRVLFDLGNGIRVWARPQDRVRLELAGIFGRVIPVIRELFGGSMPTEGHPVG